MFVEIFERFKDELLAKTNINNRYFLQGVLKYKFSSDFYYTRDTISKDKNSTQNTRDMIEEFIKEKERIVTKEEIKEKFKGVTEIVINLATTGNPNILV
jgi:hypothetical protein